jgi:P4 family phage/plasmid primase-like protien
MNKMDDNDYTTDDIGKATHLNYTSLIDFIDNNKSINGSGKETHQYINNVIRKNFTVSDEKYDIFMKLYIKEIKDNMFAIMEKTKDVVSLYLDFDIKHVNNERLYTIDNIKTIVKTINKLILKYFDIIDDNISSDSENSTQKVNYNIVKSYILIKDDPVYNEEKKLFSDGFHIHYPNLILNKIDRLYLFEKIKKKLLEDDLMIKIMEKTNSDFDSIFDKKVITDTKWWYLYSSGKIIHNGDEIVNNIYKVIKCVDYDMNDCPIENNKKLIKLLSIRNPKNNLNGYIKTKFRSEYESIEKTIKKSNKKLSVNDYFIKDNMSEMSETTALLKSPDVEEFNIKSILNKNNQSDVDLAKKIIPLLNEKRADDYGTWIAVGWALHNVSPSLLLEFHAFSKKSKKYDKNSCNKIWSECRTNDNENKYKIGSLCRWAMDDNKEEFYKIQFEKTSNMFEILDFTKEHDICCIIKEVYKNDFICSDIEKHIWYFFEKHRWNVLQKAQDFNTKLAEEFVIDVAKISGILSIKGANERGNDADKYLRKSKEAANLIKQLKTNDYRKKLIEACELLFYDRRMRFNELLDENIYIVGFNNGVYDLQQKRFRDGLPEDYLTFSTNYNYIEYSYDHEYVINIEKFFSSVYTDDKLKIYVLCYLSSILKGGNSEQIMMFWIGFGGSNGKGTITNFLDYTLGDYFSTVGIELLTRKTGKASDASPALADKKGKRLLSMQETEAGDKLQLGFMKSLTGEDKILARGLYKDPFYFVPQFKMIISCNVLPDIVSDDGGTWRRIKVVEYTERFVDNPKKSNEHKKDPKLKENLKKWRAAFMWLLINKYYIIYEQNGLENLEPECVKLATNKYKEDSNIIIDFMNNHYGRSENEKDTIKVDEAWTLFGEWFRSNTGPTSKLPFANKKFRELIHLMDYKIVNNAIIGIVSTK